MHYRKIQAETSQGKVYYTTQQWLMKKAEERIRSVVKERLAPPGMRSKLSEDTGREKLLLHELQPKEFSETGLVHSAGMRRRNNMEEGLVHYLN